MSKLIEVSNLIINALDSYTTLETMRSISIGFFAAGLGLPVVVILLAFIFSDDMDCIFSCGMVIGVIFYVALFLFEIFAIGYGWFIVMRLGITSLTKNAITWILTTGHVILFISSLVTTYFIVQDDYDFLLHFWYSISTFFGSYVISVLIFGFIGDWKLTLTILLSVLGIGGLITLEVFSIEDGWEQYANIIWGLVGFAVGTPLIILGTLSLHVAFTTILLPVNINLQTPSVIPSIFITNLSSPVNSSGES